jgi:hypothetical protein
LTSPKKESDESDENLRQGKVGIPRGPEDVDMDDEVGPSTDLRKTVVTPVDGGADESKSGSAPLPQIHRSRSSDDTGARTEKGRFKFGKRSPRSGTDVKPPPQTPKSPAKSPHNLRVSKAIRKKGGEPTNEELTERVRKLVKVESRMFAQDILNDPSAVGRVLTGEALGIKKSVFSGSELVDWVVNSYDDVSRKEGVYLGKRMLRSKCFYALDDPEQDMEDDPLIRFKFRENNFTEAKVMSLMNVDVIGGTVTDRMKRIITTSVHDPMDTQEKSASKEGETQMLRGSTIMSPGFSLETDDTQKDKEEVEGDDEDEDGEDERKPPSSGGVGLGKQTKL